MNSTVKKEGNAFPLPQIAFNHSDCSLIIVEIADYDGHGFQSCQFTSAFKSTEIWLDSIEEHLEYKHWYAGHYHTEKNIDKLSIMFESIREFTVLEAI